MSRRRKGRHVSGILLLDKPAGLSSNQALQRVRHAFGARKAGHTGTLDPFATGMLPVCLGEATKTTAFMLDADKAYRAVARLGEATSTGDPEGEVVHRLPVPEIDEAGLAQVLKGFEGESEQVPPMYSALKHEGRRLYELAREGIEVERKARRVVIHECRLIDWSAPELTFEVRCAKGTYIRTLAEDIAKTLGSCAHLLSLRRLFVDPFDGADMVAFDDVVTEPPTPVDVLDTRLLPADAGLPEWPVVQLDQADAARFGNGNPVASHWPDGPVRVHAGDGRILGLGECDAGELRPQRVFVQEVG